MENRDLKSMTIDDLWELHEQVTAKLVREIAIEKARLEERLHKIGSASKVSPRTASAVRTRRSFPNTGIRKILLRLGLAAANNPAG